MIPVAFESPKSLLYRNVHVQDYNFALAHYVLEDRDYREFFQTHRCHVLDNGFHELGRPLSVPELVEAIRLVHPKVVVAPDWLDEPQQTLEACAEMGRALEQHGMKSVKIMGVVQGTNLDEVYRCWDAMRNRVEVIGLPFRRNRLDWWYHCDHLVLRDPWKEYHLLGMNELDEIRKFRQFASFKNVEAAGRVRIDTSKPYKWAMLGKTLLGLNSVRGSGVPAEKLYDAALNPEELQLAFYNVACVRKVLA